MSVTSPSSTGEVWGGQVWGAGREAGRHDVIATAMTIMMRLLLT